MRILVLDDDNERHNAFHWALFRHDLHQVHTHDQAVRFLREYSPYDIVFLDHDLNHFEYSSPEKTGHDVAKMIAALPKEKQPREVVVHSWNPAGADNMMRTLQEAGVRTSRWLFNSDVGALFK